MDWYFQFSQLLSYISEPLGKLYYSQQVPFVGAIILGLLGALAPCQISSNLGIISYTTNRMSRGEVWYKEITSFFIGKTLVYFVLGMSVLLIGKGIEPWTIPIYQVTRKIIGPLFLFTGLYFVGLIKIRGMFTERLLKYRGLLDKLTGNKRGFLLGILLSLAFCPTMFLIFFGLLMPLVLNTTTYGLALPFIFSVGTFLPVLLFIGLAYGFGLDRTFIKKSKKVGKMIQVISGVILILLGINDIILYWGLF